MLNDEICKLREELNNSIINGEDYEKTYKISVKLDQLIAEYYKVELELKDGKIRNVRSSNSNGRKVSKEIKKRAINAQLKHFWRSKTLQPIEYQ